MTDDTSSVRGVLRRTVLKTTPVAVGSLGVIGTATATPDEEDNDENDGDDEAIENDTNETDTMAYELPELPYDHDALEPQIDERIMELHHEQHHQAYVDGANAALDRFDEMRDAGNFDGIKSAKRDYSFHLSGHVNHSIFWESMSPDGGGEPENELADAIDEEFGSFEDFQDEFTAAAGRVEGDGWGMLFYEPVGDRLVVGQMESQNHLAHQSATPLLVLDVWEHAYYLQYENRRAEYVEEWWNVVNWEDVGQRYDQITG